MRNYIILLGLLLSQLVFAQDPVNLSDLTSQNPIRDNETYFFIDQGCTTDQASLYTPFFNNNFQRIDFSNDLLGLDQYTLIHKNPRGA